MQNNSFKSSFKKTIISVAMTGLLTQAAPLQADVLDFDFSGLWTYLDNAGGLIENTSEPYYSDPTWGYGVRTQISGKLTFDTITGSGTATINPFIFLSAGANTFSNIEFKSIGGNLLIAHMSREWNGTIEPVSVVWDASGFLGEALTMLVNDTVSGVGAIPASNNLKRGFPIGLLPLPRRRLMSAVLQERRQLWRSLLWVWMMELVVRLLMEDLLLVSITI